jgi:hypothetical protein
MKPEYPPNKNMIENRATITNKKSMKLTANVIPRKDKI